MRAAELRIAPHPRQLKHRQTDTRHDTLHREFRAGMKKPGLATPIRMLDFRTKASQVDLFPWDGHSVGRFNFEITTRIKKCSGSFQQLCATAQ
ncbi:hypothetical protein AA103581_1463 [Gluconobacter wancherniae NBRC 103581]|nr:hypothetical protein AA103581_1463 [Gluconobacter wancherniae NBRC 103581]